MSSNRTPRIQSSGRDCRRSADPTSSTHRSDAAAQQILADLAALKSRLARGRDLSPSDTEWLLDRIGRLQAELAASPQKELASG